ncbi:aldehyde dehydrogenase family protein [Nocardia sp. R16R-3T]
MNAIEMGLVTPTAFEANGVIEVRNPARTDEVVGTLPRIRPEHIDTIVTAAHEVQRGWAAVPVRERFELVARALQNVDVEGLDVLLTREQGKVLSESTRELKYLSFPVAFLEQHLDWLDNGEDLGRAGANRTLVFRDPVGVVGIISPWNVPVSMAVVSVTPALVAGNSAVVHVPVTAPLAALSVFGKLAASLPPGVLSLITSDETKVAQALVEHPLVRHVHFTGSTGVGKIVASEGAPKLTGLTLELGGNDAAIMLDDAFEDESVFERIVAGAFAMGGQACIAIKRLYVPEGRVDEVLGRLGSILSSWGVGDGLDPKVQLGPMHTAAGRARIERLLAASRSEGAEVHTFGTLRSDPAEGHFVQPALVTGLSEAAPLVREEQFGPVLPILGYSGVDEAVARANNSELGLGASVWSKDIDRAVSLARRIEAGMSWINAHGGAAIDGRAPWGGVKDSGMGRGGANRAGLEAFTHAHSITLPI